MAASSYNSKNPDCEINAQLMAWSAVRERTRNSGRFEMFQPTAKQAVFNFGGKKQLSPNACKTQLTIRSPNASPLLHMQ
jgi:hypothetical protein